jgi:ornithine cyclodeaminase/alanine dehydrogenase-like protein (mu-crystallin family)
MWPEGRPGNGNVRGRRKSIVLFLRETDVRALLTMEDAIRLMDEALRALSTGGVVQPVRLATLVEPHGGYLGLMPAYRRAAPSDPQHRAPSGPGQGSGEALGAKAVTFYPRNADRGLPTHLAAVLLWDARTGEPLAMLDGRLITEMRTAATSAAATGVLARRGASTLALLGAGVQARSHLEALRLVRPVRRVRVWSRTEESARRFADERRGVELPIHVSATAEEAVRDAELIVTATSSPTPVLQGRWLADGAHINAVGAPRPDWRELDTEAVRRAQVFVDSRAGASREAGDLLIPMREGAITEQHIRGEIGEVLAGIVPGRTDDRQITLFKSLGMAVEDVATAHHVYTRARERGVGQEISF